MASLPAASWLPQDYRTSPSSAREITFKRQAGDFATEELTARRVKE